MHAIFNYAHYYVYERPPYAKQIMEISKEYLFNPIIPTPPPTLLLHLIPYYDPSPQFQPLPASPIPSPHSLIYSTYIQAQVDNIHTLTYHQLTSYIPSTPLHTTAADQLRIIPEDDNIDTHAIDTTKHRISLSFPQMTSISPQTLLVPSPSPPNVAILL